MNLVYDKDVVEEIANAQLTTAYERMIQRILDAGEITNQTTGKGVMQVEDGVKAVALLPTVYFVVEMFEHRDVDGVKVFCVFKVVDTENDSIPGGQVLPYLKGHFTKEFRRGRTSDGVLIAYAKEYMSNKNGDDGAKVKDDVPLSYSGWMQHLDPGYILDGVRPLFVKETRLWARNFKEVLSEDHYVALYKLLSGIFYKEEDEEVLLGVSKTKECYRVEGEDDLYLLKITRMCFLCRYRMGAVLDLSGKQDGSRAVQCRELTLVNMWRSDNEADEICRVRDEYEQFKKQPCRAFRFYPGRVFMNRTGAVTGDYDRWREMENTDKPVCIEFSDEEMEIIFGGDRKFPILVNGSAGSGKSTALYWLFAAYWLKNREDASRNDDTREMRGQPMFITLSPELQKHAKKTVADIIRFSSDLGNEITEKKLQEQLDGSMMSFGEVLTNLLGNVGASFAASNEVQFETFKNLLTGASELDQKLKRYTYQVTQLDKHYTPELCWHIIRCYIKGYPGRDFYDREKFIEFLEARRESNDEFVDSEGCLYVWDWIWPWYRGITVENEAGSLWDQQDLVLKATAAIVVAGNHLPAALNEITALFCDESQDFTGIELNLIQKLSKLLRYKIPQEVYQELPFAFAGDPLQTLNPSGFRWEDLKRGLDENILEAAGVRYRITPFHLKQNYRSPMRIVYWANMVQLVRRMLFGEKITPQKPDKDYNGELYLTIREKDGSISEDESKQLSDCVILLPCSQGEMAKNTYIAHDAILNDIVNVRKVKSKDEILSVLDAKGMDIQRVVLWDFGETLFQDERGLPDTTDGVCKNISYSYALNKVYVGITRATERLGIVDTWRGVERFWSRVGSEQWKERYLEAIPKEDQEDWVLLLPDHELENYRCEGIFGDDDNEMTEEQLLAEATSWFDNAFIMENARQMLAAARRFERFNKYQAHKLACEAFAHKFNRKYETAATVFREALSRRGNDSMLDIDLRAINLGEEEFLCYWASCASWTKICDLRYAKLEHPECFLVAQIMEALRTRTLTAELLEKLVVLPNEAVKRIKLTAQWRGCLSGIVAAIGDSYNNVERAAVNLDELEIGLCRDLVNYLQEWSLARADYNFCARAVVHLYMKLVRRVDDDIVWEEAYKFIQKFGGRISGMENECDIIAVHKAPWPIYAIRAQMVGEYELCAQRWIEEGNDVDIQKLAKYSNEQQRMFIECLFRAGVRVAGSGAKWRYDNAAIKSAQILRQWQPLLNGRIDLMSKKQLCDTITKMLDSISPSWREASALLAHAFGLCETVDDVNSVLSAVLAVKNGNLLKEGGSEVFVDKLIEQLESGSISRMWPKTGDDMRTLASVVKSIGIMRRPESYALWILKRESDQEIRDVAAELYIYAARDFMDKRFSGGEAERRRIKKSYRDNFIEHYLKTDEIRGGAQFEEYWEAVPSFNFNHRKGSALIRASGVKNTHVCVVGAKYDDENENYRLTKKPLRFVETESKITITHIDKGSRAVIPKDDWNNQSNALQDIGLHNTVEYKVAVSCIIIQLPEWEEPVKIVF